MCYHQCSIPIALEKGNKIIEQFVLVSFLDLRWQLCHIYCPLGVHQNHKHISQGHWGCWGRLGLMNRGQGHSGFHMLTEHRTNIIDDELFIHNAQRILRVALSRLDRESSSSTRRGWAPATILEKSPEKFRPVSTWTTVHGMWGLWAPSIVRLSSGMLTESQIRNRAD